MLERAWRKWSPEQDAMLRRLYEGGELLAAIAATINQEFGTSYTVAAVQVRAASWLGLRRETRRPAEWTDEATAQLRELVASRKPHRVIAEIMGLKRTAVHRQIHRLGLHEQLAENAATELATSTAKTAKRRETAQRRTRLAKLMNWVPGKYREEAPLPIFCAVVDDPLNLSMAEVGPNQCRYIMNNDAADPKFCGHSTTRKSWCARHAEVVLA